jgi:hypothetical protein
MERWLEEIQARRSDYYNNTPSLRRSIPVFVNDKQIAGMECNGGIHFNKILTMRQNHFFTAILIGLFAFTLIGCSNPDTRFAMVEGTITYKGQPVEGATVTFVPESSVGEAASGMTGTGGRFTLNSSGAARAGSGALPGEYTVLVVKREARNDPSAEARRQLDEAYERGEITYDQFDTRRQAIPGPPSPVNMVPEKYSNPRQSGLRATVEQGKNNTFTFDLVD